MTRFAVVNQRLTLDGMTMFTRDFEAFASQLSEVMARNSPQLVVTANVDQVLRLGEDPTLARAYEAAAIRTLDGVPLVAAARLLGVTKVHRMTGADLLTLLSAASLSHGWSIAITGGAEEIVAAACANLRLAFPGLRLWDVAFPFVKDVSAPEVGAVVSRLVEIGPDIVFVCLGSPKQEAFFLDWRNDLPPAVYLGVGAAVDFAAGVRSRAPVVVQRCGLEWLWRLVQEPRRLAGRYLLRGPRFIRVLCRSFLAAWLRTPDR